MDEKIVRFLKTHRIAVLTTIISRGLPHSASLHYAFSQDPFYFIFLTDLTSRKMEMLNKGKPGPASVTIGFSEEEWITMQLEGEIKWIPKSEDEFVDAWINYSTKFTGVEKHKEDNNSAVLKFTPKWWRYTEVKPSPTLVISCEDTIAGR